MIDLHSVRDFVHNYQSQHSGGYASEPRTAAESYGHTDVHAASDLTHPLAAEQINSGQGPATGPAGLHPASSEEVSNTSNSLAAWGTKRVAEMRAARTKI